MNAVPHSSNQTNDTALAGQASFYVPVSTLTQALERINSTYDPDTLRDLYTEIRALFFDTDLASFCTCRDAICKALTKRLPTPELVTCETDYGAAYGWKIEAAGLIAYGNTRLDCLLNFDHTHLAEYRRHFGKKSTSITKS
jgi:hypothetical protein